MKVEHHVAHMFTCSHVHIDCVIMTYVSTQNPLGVNKSNYAVNFPKFVHL